MFNEIEEEDGTQGDEENSKISNQNTENTKEVIYKVEKKQQRGKYQEILAPLAQVRTMWQIIKPIFVHYLQKEKYFIVQRIIKM